MIEGRVIHCANACGRYTSLAALASKPESEQWSEDPTEHGKYLCPRCFRGRLKRRAMAQLVAGERIDPRLVSPIHREAAAELMPPDLLAAMGGANREKL